jgi:fucose 4-O-acetylase-like acetyltransferase
MSTEKSKKPRLLYIDNLRILLTILVIMHHFAIGYGAPGGFFYWENGPMSDISEILLTLFVAMNQSFFMGFFFMISSYFSPGSIDRKGGAAYLKDRLKRLGIPLLFYMLVIVPLLNYGSNRLYRSDLSLGEYLTWQYSSILNFGAAQMWFVAALLFFAIIQVIWRRFAKPMANSDEPAPGNLAIAIFALVLGLVTFTVRIWLPVGWEIPILSWQVSHFPQYIALYILGLVAYRRNWFETITDSQRKVWSRMIVVLVASFPVLFVAAGALEGNVDSAMGGFHWESLAYSVWEQFMCMAMVITLLVWFRNRFNEQGGLAKNMSGAAYATYVFHAPTIFLVALALRGIRLDMALKYVLVVPFAVAAAFLVGYITKKLPIARNIL